MRIRSLLQKKIFYIFLGVVVILFVVLINLSRIPTQTEPSPSVPTPTPRPIRSADVIHSDEEPYAITPNPSYREKLTRERFWNELPHWTDRYKIEYRDSANVILIHLFLPENVTNADKNSLQVQYRDEALTWLRENGANIDSLTIQYRVYE